MPLYGDRFDSDGWPIPEDFFRQVHDIALWIGTELEARGIHVLQAKEKFGGVRVYLSGFAPDQHGAYREVCLEAISCWPHYAKYILFGLGWGNLLGPVMGERQKKGEPRRGEPIEPEVRKEEEMTKQMEKLVEEIAEILYGSTLYALTKRESLDEAITLTLSAIRDGRLELPGEVGRGFIERTVNEDRVFWSGGAHNLSVWVEAEVEFIALRKEGTAKTREELPVNCKCGKVAIRVCSALGCIVALCDDCSCPHGS